MNAKQGMVACLPMVLGALLLTAGCSTNIAWYTPSSVPVPAGGYKVIGSDVTGTCDQIWVFGLGGSASQSQQHRALKEAMGNAVGADALVGMTIDRHNFCLFPFFWMETTRVTGTPVSFNRSK